MISTNQRIVGYYELETFDTPHCEMPDLVQLSKGIYPRDGEDSWA